jgi:hypothetical protein
MDKNKVIEMIEDLIDKTRRTEQHFAGHEEEEQWEVSRNALIDAICEDDKNMIEPFHSALMSYDENGMRPGNVASDVLSDLRELGFLNKYYVMTHRGLSYRRRHL